MPLPAEIAARLDIWDVSSNWNIVGGIALIVGGVLASSAVVALTDQLDKKYIKLLGFVAAVCTALISAFNPLSLGFAYRDAWRVLDSAILHYDTDPIKYPVQTVVDAVDEGEAIISAASKGLVRSPKLSMNANNR